MGALPDEIWREILTLGISNSKLSYKDLCCVSISSKRLNKLSTEDLLWSTLTALDFPNSNPILPQSPIKNHYKYQHQKEKHRNLSAHRRAVFFLQSQVNVHASRVKEMKGELRNERGRLRGRVEELRELERGRSAEVGLRVWQPEVVRGMQRSVVEQCGVSGESRRVRLEMDVRVCRKQIQVLERGCRVEEKRLGVAKGELERLVYHPLRNYGDLEEMGLIRDRKIQRKRNKLKQCSEDF